MQLMQVFYGLVGATQQIVIASYGYSFIEKRDIGKMVSDISSCRKS
jgi:hypothetical protein